MLPWSYPQHFEAAKASELKSVMNVVDLLKSPKNLGLERATVQ